MTNYSKLMDNTKSVEIFGRSCGFVTFQKQTFAMFQMLSDEAAGKVVKAASKFLTGAEEPDLSAFAEAEKVCYRFLLQDTQQRWDGYLESCRKKSEKAKEREANKKQQSESRTVQNSAELCRTLQNSAEQCRTLQNSAPIQSIQSIQDNTLHSLHSLQALQDNTKQSSSSSSLARTREDDEEDKVYGLDNVNRNLPYSAREVLEIPLEGRKKAFWDEIFTSKNLEKYDKETLNQFYAYYSNIVAESGLMLFEELKLNPKNGRRGMFDVTRRLIKWKDNNKINF